MNNVAKVRYPISCVCSFLIITFKKHHVISACLGLMFRNMSLKFADVKMDRGYNSYTSAFPKT